VPRRGRGTILEFRISEVAVRELNMSVAPLGKLGNGGWFLGGEIVVPFNKFATFNRLLANGEITVSPVSGW